MKRIIARFSAKGSLDRSIKNLLGFWPVNISLYEQAFRHRSKAMPVKDDFKSSNERLEYLGDAVLGAAIAHYLFKKYPFKNEGFLTEMRSRIVNRSYLSNLAIRMGIDKLVQVDEHTNCNKSISGNSFEALIGAIYLDKGFDFTFQLILKRIIKYHVDIDELEQNDNNHKSRLINWAQRHKYSVIFEAREEQIGKNQKRYWVKVLVNQKQCGEGIGTSKKQAEQAAAKMAVDSLIQQDSAA